MNYSFNVSISRSSIDKFVSEVLAKQASAVNIIHGEDVIEAHRTFYASIFVLVQAGVSIEMEFANERNVHFYRCVHLMTVVNNLKVGVLQIRQSNNRGRQAPSTPFGSDKTIFLPMNSVQFDNSFRPAKQELWSALKSASDPELQIDQFHNFGLIELCKSLGIIDSDRNAKGNEDLVDFADSLFGDAFVRSVGQRIGGEGVQKFVRAYIPEMLKGYCSKCWGRSRFLLSIYLSLLNLPNVWAQISIDSDGANVEAFLSRRFREAQKIELATKEMAKNIVDHSFSGQGVIWLRFSPTRDLSARADLSDTDNFNLAQYLEDDESIGVVELIVLDRSAVPFMDRYQTVLDQKLESLRQSEIYGIEEMVQSFNLTARGVSDTISPSTVYFAPWETPNFHTAFRSVVGLGIPTFVHFVESIAGQMRITVPFESDTTFVGSSSAGKDGAVEDRLCLGTMVEAVVPIRSQASGPKFESMLAPAEPSADDGFNLVWSHYLASFHSGCSESQNERLCIQIVQWSELGEFRRNPTLWKEKFPICSSCPANKNRMVHLECPQGVDYTELFRNLSLLTSQEDLSGIVVTGVDLATVRSIHNLIEFYSKQGDPFGGNPVHSLFYYQMEKDGVSERYYPYILGGKNFDDYVNINDIAWRSSGGEHVCGPGILAGQTNVEKIAESIFVEGQMLVPFDCLVSKPNDGLITIAEANIQAELL